MTIRKAVFPVGGMGTRFLPATKAVPKEMLPVVDTPIIHYAFEEARAAGIEQFIFVSSRNKDAIQSHFDHAYELEAILKDKGKKAELEKVTGWLPDPGNVTFIRQQAPLGLGHAVWCARHAVGDEAFAVILPDDMVLSTVPVLQQMVNAQAKSGGNVVAVTHVPREQTNKYGIVDIQTDVNTPPNMTKAKGLVEKPAPHEAPSTLSIIGRYILQPDIFKLLDDHQTGAGGEIQITDAIARLIETQDVFGFEYEGTRFDCGSLTGFIAANVAYGLQREEEGDAIREAVRQLLE